MHLVAAMRAHAKRVCVLGAGGFIAKNLLEGTDWVGLTHAELDLLDQHAVQSYFNKYQYDAVIHCAVQGGSRLEQDDGTVTHNNILMFENVVRVFKGLLLYFSSGAALTGDPPTRPYALSKWIIDKRIATMERAYSLRIWGCYGPGELSTRFSAICRTKGHVVIEQDRYFDYVSVADVKSVVIQYIHGDIQEKYYNFGCSEKRLLSQWAEYFGATWEVRNTSELEEPYCYIE